MAKKPAPKKAAKPVKKASKPAPKKASKPAPKKAAKPKSKAAPKKVVKPVAKKKVAAKAVVKKAAPKKAVVKKAAVKKSIVKKAAIKKVVTKKSAPVKKTTRTAAAKPAKKAAAKKVVKKAPQKAAPKAKVAPPVQKEKPVKTAPAKVKKASKKKGQSADTVKVPSKPLVTQIHIPHRPMPAPVVKKHVSTLESADKLRYTDAELVEFKDLIIRKLDEARKDYDLLKQTLANTDNNGTDDTSPSFKMIEDGSETLSREETAQLAGRQEKFIKHLEDALLRIRNKTFGICRVTGRLISKERLRLVPHATLSIEAKQQMGN